MIFAGIKLPVVKLPRSGNALLDGAIGQIERRLEQIFSNLVKQVNDSLMKVFGRLNSALPMLCIGQEIELVIEPGQYKIDQDIVIRHELGTKPTRYFILSAEPTSILSTYAPDEWNGNDTISLNKSHRDWTDTHVIFRPTTPTYLYGGKFKILIMP